MDLAQDSARRLDILDLPEDVLRDIFDCFTDEGLYEDDGEVRWYYPPSFDEHGDLKVVQNIRLVCRRFCEVASPLLAPVLYAHISSKSLSSIDGLTRNPLIARGVRLVHLSLEYRPREVALDFSLYTDLQLQKIRQLSERCSWLTEFVDPEERSDEDRKVDEANDVYRDLVHALWDPSGQRDGDFAHQPGEEVFKFRTLARRWFEEFRHEHEDQYRLLTDGSFAKGLAASIGRMTSLRALSIVDRFKICVDDYNSMSDVTVMANDMEKLRQLMVSAEDWGVMEEMSPAPVLLPARLLWELPIAMDESGHQLRELSISAMPRYASFELLCPRGQDEIQAGWDRLRAAFRCLRRVEVGGSGGNMSCGCIRNQHIPAEQRAHVNNYVGALLSGPCVEQVHIDLNPLKLHTGRPHSGISPRDRAYRIGQVLAPVCSARLRTLHLSTVALRQEELEGFFRGLGSWLETVRLSEVAVLDGGWERPLDVLREKLLGRRSSGECSVRLNFLRGGGFDSVSVYDSDDHRDMFDSMEKLEEYNNGSSGKVLHENAEKYVSGTEGMANPVAELEAGLQH